MARPVSASLCGSALLRYTTKKKEKLKMKLKVLTNDMTIRRELPKIESSKIRLDYGITTKSDGGLWEFILSVQDYAEFLPLLIDVVKLIKSKKEESQGKNTIIIQAGEHSTQVIQFIESNKGSIDIKIENK